MLNGWKKNKVDICHYSNIGGRLENEDAYGVYKNRKKYLCAVADGLGGHGGGAKASQTAINTILRKINQQELENPKQFLDWFQECNDEVCKLQSVQCRMKTTLVVLYINDTYASWAHIGDSRLYHFVNGKIEHQTYDHSVSQMAVLRGEITSVEIRGHIDRNKLLRAIGREQNIKIDISESISLKENQHAFLLCTDGFWEYIYEKEMEEALKEASSAQEWINNMLVYINDRVGKENDNNTAVAVMING